MLGSTDVPAIFNSRVACDFRNRNVFCELLVTCEVEQFADKLSRQMLVEDDLCAQFADELWSCDERVDDRTVGAVSNELEMRTCFSCG